MRGSRLFRTEHTIRNRSWSLAFLAAFSFVWVCQVQAHHSFAIYDIDTKIQRAGVLTKFVFSQPHIQLVLEAEREDGSMETWEIESMAPRRWDSFNHSRDVARVGDRRHRQDGPEHDHYRPWHHGDSRGSASAARPRECSRRHHTTRVGRPSGLESGDQDGADADVNPIPSDRRPHRQRTDHTSTVPSRPSDAGTC